MRGKKLPRKGKRGITAVEGAIARLKGRSLKGAKSKSANSKVALKSAACDSDGQHSVNQLSAGNGPEVVGKSSLFAAGHSPVCIKGEAMESSSESQIPQLEQRYLDQLKTSSPPPRSQTLKSTVALQKTVTNELVEEYGAYTEHLVLKLVRVLNLPRAQTSDYISAAYVGLLEAAERYDPASGHEFRHFAFFRIRGAIIDYIRDSSELSGRTFRQTRAFQGLYSLSECRFEDEEIRLMKQSPSRKMALFLENLAQGALLFRMSLAESEEEVLEKVSEELNAEDQMLCDEGMKKLREIVETLPEKERTILRECYFRGKALADIAREYEGMSKSWVTRLHQRALKLLKEAYLRQYENEVT